MKKLLLIDGNALLYRAYHALPPLKSDGQLVNAVYGFFLILTKVLDETLPDYVVAAFDRKEKTFRHEEYEGYKAHRPEMPEDLATQIPIIKRGLKAFEIPVLDKKRFEADDIIATMATQWSGKHKVVILSGDRDLLQLVDNTINVRSPGRGVKRMVEFDRKKVVEKYGIKPEFFVDYKALKGDSSDNIPGIKGIGKKRAERLVRNHGAVEKMYDNLDDVEDSLKSKLAQNRERVLKNKKLMSLHKDVELNLNRKDAKFIPDEKKVFSFFREFGFQSLMNKYKKGGGQMNLDI